MAIKSSRGVTSGKGTPQRLEGQNGDMSVRRSSKGKHLFVKDMNKWHSITLDVNSSQMRSHIDSLLKEVKRLKTKQNNRPLVDIVHFRVPGSDNVQLKNVGAVLKVRNAADSADGSFAAGKTTLSTTHTSAVSAQTLVINPTLNVESAAAGTQTFSAIDMNITTTNITGLDVVNIMDCKVAGSTKLKVDSTGVVSLATPLPVGSGGIGVNTLASNAILTGNTSSAIEAELWKVIGHTIYLDGAAGDTSVGNDHRISFKDDGTTKWVMGMDRSHLDGTNSKPHFKLHFNETSNVMEDVSLFHFDSTGSITLTDIFIHAGTGKGLSTSAADQDLRLFTGSGVGKGMITVGSGDNGSVTLQTIGTGDVKVKTAGVFKVRNLADDADEEIQAKQLTLGVDSGATTIKMDGENHKYMTMGSAVSNNVGMQLHINAGSPDNGASSTVDRNGGHLFLKGGKGSGTACGGDIIFQTAHPGGSSNNVLNGHHSDARFNGDNGNLELENDLLMESTAGEETTFSVTDTSGVFTIATTASTSTDANIVLDAGGEVILDSATGVHKFLLAGDADDLCTLTVAANGVTTIATADSDGTVGHLNLDIDGNLYIDVDGGSARITDDGGTYTPSHVTSIATKGYVDEKRFATTTTGLAARMGSVNTWYASNQSFGTGIAAIDWSTTKFNYSVYNSTTAVKLKSWRVVGEISSSVDYEWELWDIAIPADGTAGVSVAAKVGDTQSISATAYAIYTIGQTDLDYGVAEGRSLYVLRRYTSGSGTKYTYETVTLEFEVG